MPTFVAFDGYSDGMSTIKHPVGPQSSKVYWRRRLVVGLGLLAVLVVVLLIVIRPGSSNGATGTPVTDAATDAPAKTDTPDAGATEAPPNTIPEEETAVEGEACDPDKVQVEAITDAVDYDPGQNPQLSLTVTNTGKVSCVLNAGTAAQMFTITSGEEPYWASTDCQKDPVDAQVTLEPGVPVSSATPINWDRTRSSVETCDVPNREAVPAGGASYHLTVSVDGIESASPKQFLLY